MRTLFKALDLKDTVTTIDAMHTQDDTTQTILDGGGDHALTVKANRPRLLAALKGLPRKDVPAHSGTDRGRGRRITRTIKVLQAPTAPPDQVAFPGAAQVARLRRTRITTTGKGTNRKTTKTVEVVHVITSADHRAAPPAVPATWVRHHQRIEALHRLRDMDDDEDRSQIRTGTGPETMATLRSTAISLLRLADTKNIAAALCRNQAHPEKIITLLTS